MEQREEKTTKEIRQLNGFVSDLSRELPKVMTQKFWEAKISVKEKVEFIRIYSEYKNKLYLLIEETYPNLSGYSYWVDDLKIKTI